MQYTSCLIGELGLHEHEIKLVTYIMSCSNARTHMRYEWAQELARAHVVMVCADDEEAMRTWGMLAKNNPSIVLLLITLKDLRPNDGYFLTRPFSPIKILALLDQIFKEKLPFLLEEPIFTGEDRSVHGEERALPQDEHGFMERSVLVVDDSPTVRKQLELELSTPQCRVDFAESGEQCMVMLEKKRYDLILLDVVMPGLDGYEVCKNIRKNPQTKRTPVIMLTSKSSSFDRVRGALAGCNSYLTKPVDYEKFHKVLDEYIGPE